MTINEHMPLEPDERILEPEPEAYAAASPRGHGGAWPPTSAWTGSVACTCWRR